MRPVVGWLTMLAAGIAGDIWLKSTGFTSRLRLAFYDFCRLQVQLLGVAQKCKKFNE